MPDIFIIRDNDGADPSFPPPWDTIWQPIGIGAPYAGQGEWAVADPANEPNNVGGLQAYDELSTAVFLCLGTDKRLPAWQPSDVGGDPRGWHGDTFDIDPTLGETEMGSWLWLLERAALTDDTVRLAEYYARESLQPLVNQGAIGEIDVASEVDHEAGTLAVMVAAYDVTGQAIFKNAFPVVTGTT